MRRCTTSHSGLLWAIALSVMTGACASAGVRPRPFPMPDRRPPDIGEQDKGAQLARTALDLRGAPYRNGGQDPGGFDCSGFTQYVFAAHGLFLPREVVEQFEVGRRVTPIEVAPGDLIFFSTTGSSASHVAIAIGGDGFVHAPSSRGVVRVERLSSSYWAQRLVGIRRMTLN